MPEDADAVRLLWAVPLMPLPKVPLTPVTATAFAPPARNSNTSDVPDVEPMVKLLIATTLPLPYTAS